MTELLSQSNEASPSAKFIKEFNYFLEIDGGLNAEDLVKNNPDSSQKSALEAFAAKYADQTIDDVSIDPDNKFITIVFSREKVIIKPDELVYKAIFWRENINKDLLKAINAEYEEMVKRNKESLDELSDQLTSSIRTDEMRNIEASTALTLQTPFNDLLEETRAKLLSVSGDDKEKIAEIKSDYYRKYEELRESTEALINFLKSTKPYLPAAEIIRMHRMSSEIADVLKNKGNLLPAFKYAVSNPEKGKSVDSYKEEAFKGLMQEFEAAKTTGLDSYEARAAFMILSLFGVEKMNDFLSYYISHNTLTAEQKEAFFKAGNEFGAFSYPEAEIILGRELTEAEAEKAEENWENTRVLQEKIRDIAQESYGADNAALEMLDVNNMAAFLGKSLSLMTVGVNVFFGAWDSGKFMPLGQVIENWLQNEYIHLGLGTYFGIKVLENPTYIREKLHGETDTERAHFARQKVLTMVRADRDLNKFYKNEDGIKVFWEFIASVHKDKKIQKEKIHPDSFMKFLEKNKLKLSEKYDYGKLLELAENTETLQNEEKLENLAESFLALGIGESSENYKKELEIAINNPYLNNTANGD